MKSMKGLGVLVSLLCAPAAGAAQQGGQAASPMLAVSMYECSASTAELNQLLDGTWKPAMEQQARDGRVLNWGVLRHAWGDEWNLVLYRTVRDLAALQASNDALTTAMQQLNPQWNATLARLCARHKDNIYWVAASGPAPAAPTPAPAPTPSPVPPGR